MGEVPYCDLSLLVNVGKERSAVVDTEVENAVLIRCLEGNTENGSIRSLRDGRKVKTVEWRKHAEFELDVVIRGGNEGNEVVVVPFRDLNLVVLGCC